MAIRDSLHCSVAIIATSAEHLTFLLQDSSYELLAVKVQLTSELVPDAGTLGSCSVSIGSVIIVKQSHLFLKLRKVLQLWKVLKK